MTNNVLLSAGSSPKISNWEYWDSLRQRMTCHWRLPDADLDASLLMALSDMMTPPANLGLAARRKADEIEDWAGVCLVESSSDHLLLQRKLFRAVYCDWPNLANLLVLLATHHARLFFRAGTDTATAMQTRRAYVSVTRMLGLWRLQRAWIEESMRRTQPDKYAKIANQLDIPWSSDTDADLLEDKLLIIQQEWAGDNSGELPKAGKFDIDSRMRVFTRLRKQLDEALVREFGPDQRPHLELMPMMPGVTLFYSILRRQSLDEWLAQLPQLHLRLYCESESDCYRALGVFHRVAPPIRPSDDTRFRDFTDHIARPNPNGYRALQTICRWPAGREGRLVRCHILTEQMQDINEWGVMSQEGGAGQSKMGLNRSMERYSRSLGRNSGDDIVTYMRQHDLNDQPDPIYCFTPHGEIVVLKKGSLPLDFAYRVHTQIGHQATRIEVNEQVAELKTPLKNGDLVHIAYDPSAPGLDFSWQEKVTWERARTNIRAELRRRASQIHPGRGKFEAELIRLIDVYRRDSDRRRTERGGMMYEPPIPTSNDIEHFLDRAMARRHLQDRMAFYDQLEMHSRLPGELAHRLLSECIIPALRTPDGQPLRQRAADIALCPACRPTPRDEICAFLRSEYEGDMIVIHLPGCAAISPVAEPIDLSWDENNTDRWPLYLFKIGTPDEDGLLDRLLGLVYDTPHTYLYRVKASVTEKKRANIQLTVAVKLPQLCADLGRLLTRAGVEVSYSLLRNEPRRSPVHPEDRSRALDNPYTLSPVSDWRFFNRGRVLDELMRWADDTHASSPVMLLHGQQRIGKSSVAMRLGNKLAEHNSAGHRLAATIIPLYIDFSTARLDDPGATCDLLIQQICSRLKMNRATRPPDADPIVWLDSQLLDATSSLGKNRLLIILDEFDGQLGRLEGAGQRFTVPDRLLGIIRNHAEKIRWLLVVQDAHLADPRHEGLFSRLLSAPRVHVGPLESPYARQLIENPIHERNYHFADSEAGRPDIPARILDLTAGIPYFIHLIGSDLLERVRTIKRRTITSTDLDWTIQYQLGRPAMLDHFTDPLRTTPSRHQIAVCVAANTQIGERLPLSTLYDELIHDRRLMDEVTMIQELRYLQQIGVLNFATNEFGEPGVTMPIQLIHLLLKRWIKDPNNHDWKLNSIDDPSSPNMYPGG